MSNKQPTPYNLLKNLYSFAQNKSLAFKNIMTVHKKVFWALEQGKIEISEKQTKIQQEIAEYKLQNHLFMDQEIMCQCVSIYDIYLGRQISKQKIDIKKFRILQRHQERNLEKQKSQKSLIQKEQQYKQKMKQYQKQRQLIEEKKKAEEIKRINQIKQQQQKLKIEKQKEIQRQKQQKKKKLQSGLRQMEQKRRKRQQMIKELAIQHKRSQSMNPLEPNIPKYIQLQKQYLQKERRKVEQTKQIQQNRRQSMQLRIDQIKNHQKQYIQKLKSKFTSKARNYKSNLTEDIKPTKTKSEFNIIRLRNEEEQEKFRQKVSKRKQFESKLRNIPIHIDINKKIQKQIQIDKAIHKQKYILLAKRHLDDQQIFNEFKDFEIKIDPRNLGKNYLHQLREIPKAPKSQRIGRQGSLETLDNQPSKSIYINYLEQLKAKSSHKLIPKIQQSDELLKLVEQGKKIIKKQQYEQQQNIFINNSRVSLKQSSTQKQNGNSAKFKQNQLKKQVTKSITQKIEEYERKVLKKVNDLKKISQYNDSLKRQDEIDDLFTKVLKAKIDTIHLT